MRATAYVGFCYPCQQMHIREHTHKEDDKELYCNRTNALIYSRCHPPIPVMADESEINDPDLRSVYGEDAMKKSPDPPSIKDLVEYMLEDILLTVGIDHLGRHRREISAMVSQIHIWMDQELEPEQQQFLFKRESGT